MLVLRPYIRGIPETIVCRILMFMWSLGVLMIRYLDRLAVEALHTPYHEGLRSWSKTARASKEKMMRRYC